MRTPRLPSYRLHKATDKAIVTIKGRDFYLGAYGSAESRAEYHRLISEYAASGAQPRAVPSLLTIAEVVERYTSFARGYYVKAGKVTSQVDRINLALTKMVSLYAETLAVEFGPLSLQAVRQEMVKAGWKRKYINQMVACIKRAFKWAAAQQLLPVTVFQALATVEGLRKGRTTARESEPVRPVREELIEPVLKNVSPVIAAMIRLQLCTAMRPGEVCAIRPCDIDRIGDVWVCRIQHESNKTGGEGIAYLGPKAQAIIRPFLLRDSSAYCFSAREAAAWFLEKEGRAVKWGRRRPGERYVSNSYSHAVKKGCRRAFPAPEGVDTKTWEKSHRFHPHQLRHSAATRIRAEFGPEAARAVLRHRSLVATEIYAEADMEKAMEAMKRVG